MDRFLTSMATGFGAGRLPWAPGTAGSAVGLALAALLQTLPAAAFLAAGLFLFVVGIVAADRHERLTGITDDPAVVIDEIVGMMLSVWQIPLDPLVFAVAFGLFRFFDIFKPYPIRILERRLPGGAGVMADDLGAAVYTNLTLQLLIWIGWLGALL